MSPAPEPDLTLLDLSAKIRLLSGASFFRTAAEPAVGLAELVLSDGPVGPRGAYWDERSTTLLTPSPTALAATWDPDLVERVGHLLGRECRRMGVHVLLAPTVNLHRSPYGGRHFECFSEDPLLTARIAVGYVRGVQDEGVAATVKHYVANDSETERFTVDVRVDERALRELYFVPFESVVAAGVWAVMSAYNGVNGTTMSESPLLDDPLRAEWGFDGLVMSDWTAVRSVDAARAEQDLAMPGPSAVWGAPLLEAVRSGAIDESAIDRKLRRLLRLAARVGRLGAAAEGEQAAPDPTELRDGRELLRQVAARGTVLLRNAPVDGRPVLPFGVGELASVALIGPNAGAPRLQGGGSAGVYPERTVAPLTGLREALGSDVDVTVRTGCFLDDQPVPLTPDDTRDPVTGAGGLRVRYLAADGSELRSELRLAGKLLWLGDERLGDVASIEVHADLVPTVAGEWLLALGGVGRYRLDVDGVQVIDEVFSPGSGDPAAGLAEPMHATHTVTAEVGRPIRLVAHHELHDSDDVLDGRLLWLAARPPRPTAADELAAAVELARRSTAAVVIVGTTERIESEGFDRSTLALPGEQDALVRAVAAANPRTVVVVNAGAPVLMPWADDVAAVLLCWFPGQEFGRSLADVLLGTAEPAGRLPTGWPDAEADLAAVRPVDGVLRYAEGLRVGYRDGGVARYPFGFGLGYTSWRISGPAVLEPTDSGATVEVTVHNDGTRHGRHVVQAYLSRPDSAIDRPARWLAGFATVELEAGATAQVRIDIAGRAFEHWQDGWQREPGEFVVSVGSSSADTPVSATI